MSNKRILQLGGGLLQTHSVQQWMKAGYEVHIADKNPNAPAFKIAHKQAVIDIIDTDAIVEYAKKNSIHLILAINDGGVIAAADASEKLGLKNLSKLTARMATDKGLMREAWRKNKLSQPSFAVVDSADKLKEAIKNIGFPCIVKPCLNWGSRGVASIMKQEDIGFAIDYCSSNDRNGRNIVEQYINGTEMTYEGLAQNGKIQILSRSDKVHQKHDRFKVAMQLNYPPALPQKWIDLADKLVINAATALGITDGAIHCELMVNENSAYLVEMAARPGGGHIFGKIVEAQSGVPMPLALAKIFLNEPIDIFPKFQKGVCYHFFSPPKGIFQSIEGIEKAKKTNGVIDIGFSLKSGTKVGDIAGDADRPGYIVTQGKTRDEAMHIAENTVRSLTFKMLDKANDN